jgi:hypothetical protein
MHMSEAEAASLPSKLTVPIHILSAGSVRDHHHARGDPDHASVGARRGQCRLFLITRAENKEKWS